MINFKIKHFESITSTNTYLKDQILKNEDLPEGTVIVTDFQSGGRGQRGNTWESEPQSNLLFSLLLSPNSVQAIDQFILSQLISLAIKKVLDTYTTSITIKWPNDIYWENKKIAGILIENTLIGDCLKHTIVGVGLNVNQTQFLGNSPNPISLKTILGKDFDIDILLKQILNEIASYYIKLPLLKDTIRSEYKKSLFRKKDFYLYQTDVESFYARIIDIEDTGLLILEDEEHNLRKYAFKEVRYIL